MRSINKGGITINNTIDLFGFEDIKAKDVKIESDDLEVDIEITLEKQDVSCPFCCYNKLKIKEYITKRIVHKHFTGKICIIRYRQRRYLCKKCKKTFYEKNPFVFNDDLHISQETVLYLLDEFKTTQSFKSIALKAGISIYTVFSIFDKYVQISPKKLPVILGIDEFHNTNTGDGKYACILVDNDKSTANIIDLLPNRRIETLSSYFQCTTFQERAVVKYFSSDMYDGYKNIHDTYFPHSIHVIDTFHYIRMFTDAVTKIRIITMKKYAKDSLEYKILKKYNFVLTMSAKKFKKDKVYFKSFNKWMNHFDLLHIVLGINFELTRAYYIKERFVTTYYRYNYQTARKFIDETIQDLRESNFEVFEEVGASLEKWKEQILNSYLKYNGKKVTNARTEGFNNLVKVIKRVSYGYQSFKRFRNRILYIQENNK